MYFLIKISFPYRLKTTDDLLILTQNPKEFQYKIDSARRGGYTGSDGRKGFSMWIRVKDIKLPADAAPDAGTEREQLLCKICKMLCMKRNGMGNLSIYRKSPDLRKKSAPLFVYTVDVELLCEQQHMDVSNFTVIRKPENGFAEYMTKIRENNAIAHCRLRPVVVGFGPAGMFAGLLLAEAGLRPVILERGRRIDDRVKDVDLFWKQNRLDPESNIQFGEGGAGTFSDGKLNSMIREKDTTGRFVLEAFVKFGAPEEILYKNKPHIGTDNLRKIVKNIREYIICKGGEIRFGALMTELRAQQGGALPHVCGVTVRSGEDSYTLDTNSVFLAVGHSARDTFLLLRRQEIAMEKKPFSVGLRIEHLQKDIDKAQYGPSARLMRQCGGPADYKLSYHAANGRGVYTFCMCPGGFVVGAASEHGGLVTNGMSNYDRAGRNANAAILVGVSPEDFAGEDVLSGVEFQRNLERAAFRLGGNSWKAPCQLVGDFLAGRETTAFGAVEPTYPNGCQPADLRSILPDEIYTSLKESIPVFGKRISGFDRADAVLTGCETRSSSPVRILRDEAGCSVSMTGLYPVGEGAGYAGGILSAAADGIKTVEKWLDTL